MALRSLDGTNFVLAGSGAIREHGLVNRPTEDVDLFTSDVDLPRCSSAVDAVVNGLREAGHDVAELRRVDQFARLEVTTADGHQVDIDMGVDWREAEPALLPIGPVLSLEDAVGNKLSALYSRAYARDFLDVDSIRASGRFSDPELIRSAVARDPGFEVPMFVIQLELVHRVLPDFDSLRSTPALQEVVARHFSDAVAWSGDRKREHVELMIGAPDPGPFHKGRSGRGLVETRLVADLERTLGWRARPFQLRITEIPLAGRELWQLDPHHVLLTAELLRDSDEYRRHITPVLQALL